MDIAFSLFALGRAAGGAAEFLDHQDFGTEMDMRVPVAECRPLSRPRELERPPGGPPGPSAQVPGNLPA
jgi:hypothetical protein